jgi:hypothetical protein
MSAMSMTMTMSEMTGWPDKGKPWPDKGQPWPGGGSPEGNEVPAPKPPKG